MGPFCLQWVLEQGLGGEAAAAEGSPQSQGSHLSNLGLLSRALYLRGPPSAVSTTSTSVKMVITFIKGEKERKEGFQAAWNHTKICLELCWLLLPPSVHP